MNGDLKCPCEACGQNIAFPTANLGSAVLCPHCKNMTRLRVAAPPPSADTPEGFLLKVRARTCYSALRNFVELCKFAGLFVAWTPAVVLAYRSLDKMDPSPWQVNLGIFLWTVAGTFLTFAFTQAALLLVDIADTQLEAHRPKATLAP